jgi:hypothetical protein
VGISIRDATVGIPAILPSPDNREDAEPDLGTGCQGDEERRFEEEIASRYQARRKAA